MQHSVFVALLIGIFRDTQLERKGMIFTVAE